MSAGVLCAMSPAAPDGALKRRVTTGGRFGLALAPAALEAEAEAAEAEAEPEEAEAEAEGEVFGLGLSFACSICLANRSCAALDSTALALSSALSRVQMGLCLLQSLT